MPLLGLCLVLATESIFSRRAADLGLAYGQAREQLNAAQALKEELGALRNAFDAVRLERTPEAAQRFSAARDSAQIAIELLEQDAVLEKHAPRLKASAEAFTAIADGLRTNAGDHGQTLARFNTAQAEAACVVTEAAGGIQAQIQFITQARDGIETQRKYWTLGILGVIVACLLIFAMAAGGQISRNIEAIAAAMQNLADGKAAELPRTSGSLSEIRHMAAALETFRSNDAERQRLAYDRDRQAAADSERTAALTRMVSDFEAEIGSSLQSLRTASSGMRDVSGTLTATARATADHSVAASQETDRAASEVQMASSASRQLLDSVSDVAVQTSRTNSAARAALAEADAAQSTMQAVGRQADQVAEILGLIESVAAQTNLLALNATIEAARAGEAGRGFAVVATEVKSLAAQTAEAASNISQQIGQMRGAAADAAAAIASVNTRIAEVSAIAGSVAAAAEEQSAAITAMSSNVELAAKGASLGAQSIQRVTESVTTNTEQASKVALMSSSLAEEADHLTERVNRFLRDVQAA